MKTTAEQFQADIEELAHDLVRAYGLTFNATGQTADDKVLYRWMDYRLRHIAPQPREVKKSSRFPVPNLSTEIKQALSEIEARFANGEDVNCLVPCDHIPRRSWPLFRAKAMLNELIAGFSNPGISKHQEQFAA